MMKSETIEDLVRNLEEAKDILEEIKSRIASIRTRLDPIESRLRLQGISKTSSILHGALGKIIIMPTALERDDPLEGSIHSVVEKAKAHPTFVKLKDRAENEETCRAIVRVVEERFLKARRETGEELKIALVLRWAYLPRTQSQKQMTFLGNRYVAKLNETTENLAEEIRKCGFSVYFDNGEYGGGPVVYHLSARFFKEPQTMILQMTISKEIAENPSDILRLVNCISSFKV